MIALASTGLGNGLTSLVCAVITAAAFLSLHWMKKLPPRRAKVKHLQLLGLVLTLVVLLRVPLAMESFFRIWDPSDVYNGF